VPCLCGCAGEPAPIDRRIAAHSLVGCRVSDAANVVITPLGDFGGTPAASVVDGTKQHAIDVRQDFLGVELRIADRWSGIGYADPPADVNVALWPTDDGCSVSDAVLPKNKGGMAVSSFADGKGLLVAGLEPAIDKNDSVRALALDLTGKTLPEVVPMVEGRAFATATPFGDGVLVAGGVDPSDVTDPMEKSPVTTAFVFSNGTFLAERIDLGNRARSHHGATTLASGETLLVGGTIQGVVLPTMVAVDPAKRNTRVFGLGTLQTPRKDPTVLRLANDQILVGGGSDDNGNPVATLEWFAPDGSSCPPPACPEVNSTLPPRSDLALVALPAGGALLAGAAPMADMFDVWWITPEGKADTLESLPRPRKDARVRLVAASDGSPWAWNGTFWLRFDPWQARFLRPVDAPLDLDGPDDDMPAPVAVDPGLFVWLARDAGTGQTSVRGFRHGVRGRLSRDLPLLFGDSAHVAPDRPPQPDVVSFDPNPTTGGLLLIKPFTLPAPEVAITDTVYADFDLSADIDPGSALPEVVIGGFHVGSSFCPWPAGGIGSSFSLTRRGRTLAIGSSEVACQGPEGRVGIALRAPQFGQALVRNLKVGRR
jgi:hypothetical protein